MSSELLKLPSCLEQLVRYRDRLASCKTNWFSECGHEEENEIKYGLKTLLNTTVSFLVRILDLGLIVVPIHHVHTHLLMILANEFQMISSIQSRVRLAKG